MFDIALGLPQFAGYHMSAGKYAKFGESFIAMIEPLRTTTAEWAAGRGDPGVRRESVDRRQNISLPVQLGSRLEKSYRVRVSWVLKNVCY
jgi:hypothetical protein